MKYEVISERFASLGLVLDEADLHGRDPQPLIAGGFLREITDNEPTTPPEPSPED